jgi:hypothetical protein
MYARSSHGLRYRIPGAITDIDSVGRQWLELSIGDPGVHPVARWSARTFEGLERMSKSHATSWVAADVQRGKAEWKGGL